MKGVLVMDRLTNRQTDICDCRVTFATENKKSVKMTQFCPDILRNFQISTILHTSAEGHFGYEKCLKGSVIGFWALLLGYFENQLSS